MREQVEKMRVAGQLQEARRLGEEIVAHEGACSDDYAALFDVYLDIAHQCLATGVLSYMKGLTDRMEELIAYIADGGKARRNLDNLIKAQQPHANEMARIYRLSRESGHEAEAYEQLKPLIADPSKLHPLLHDDAGMIIYRYLRSHADSMQPIETRRLLRDYLRLDTTRPSALHSMVLGIAVRLAHATPEFNFYRFFTMWHPRNIREADITAPETDGKRRPSLLARAIGVIIDSDHVGELPSLLRSIKLQPAAIMDVVREAYMRKLIAAKRGGDTATTIALLDIYVKLGSLHAPSRWHSEILAMAIATLTDDHLDLFPQFFLDWDPDFLRDSDWTASQHDPVPLAVRALRRCYAAVRRDVPRHRHLLPRIIDLFDSAARRVADNTWLRRKHALMLSWMGCADQSAAGFRQLVRENSRDFFLWRDFADAVDDLTLKTGLLSRAMLLTDDSPMTLPARLTMAQLLHFAGLDDRAATELEIYRAATERHGEQPSPRYRAILETLRSPEPGYLDNKSCYSTAARAVDEFVYSDIPSIDMSVIAVERDGLTTTVTLTDGRGTTLRVDPENLTSAGDIAKGQNYRIKFVSTVPDRPHVMCATRLDGENYESLPEQTGFVDSCSPDGETSVNVYCGTKNSPVTVENANLQLQPGMFARFRYYSLGDRRHGVAAEIVDAAAALRHFGMMTVAVHSVEGDTVGFSSSPGAEGGCMPLGMAPENVSPGDIVDITYYVKRTPAGGSAVIPLKCTKSAADRCDAVRRVSGIVKLSPDRKSAFIKDVAVAMSLLDRAGMTADTYAIADAVLVPRTATAPDRWQAFALTPYK